MSMTLKVAYCDYPHARPIEPNSDGVGNFSNSAYQFEIHNDDGSSVGGNGLGPANEVTAWLADVKQVTVLGAFPAARGSDIGDQYGHHLELWAWAGDRPHRDGELIPVNTLIMVRFADDEIRTMLVERAWLLSENGQTIERIAP